MNDPHSRSAVPPANPVAGKIAWLVWLSAFGPLLMVQFLVRDGAPAAAGEPPVPGVHLLVALIVCAEVAVATGLRWLLIPRAKLQAQVFVRMVMGIALAEGAGMVNALVMPADAPDLQLGLLAVSLAGIVQFMPVFFRKKARSPFHEEV